VLAEGDGRGGAAEDRQLDYSRLSACGDVQPVRPAISSGVPRPVTVQMCALAGWQGACASLGHRWCDPDGDVQQVRTCGAGGYRRRRCQT
jgi:hypothetical protein